MSKYVLNDWEENGYHDSDFMWAVYDDETNSIKAVEYGSTRYAASNMDTSDYKPLTPEILEKARKLLAKSIATHLRLSDEQRIKQPWVDLKKGVSIVVSEKGKAKNKETKENKIEYIQPSDSKHMPTATAIVKNGGYISKLYINRFFDGDNVCYIYGESISCMKRQL